MAEPLRVGVVGGGPWARDAHIPLHRTEGPTSLAAVWARSPDRRARLRAEDIPVVDSFEALLEASEAIDFAVPPNVQAELAPRAAAAGKHVMLEKPLALDGAGARAVAESVADAGVASVLWLTRRFLPAVEQFLESDDPVAGVSVVQAHGGMLPDGFLVEPSPWRDAYGALADLGPHALDLAEQVAGRIEQVQVRSVDGWTTIDSWHASGAIGQHAVSGHVAGARGVQVVVHGAAGRRALDTTDEGMAVALQRLRAEFVRAALGGEPARTSAHRGLELARLLDACAESLRTGVRIEVAA